VSKTITNEEFELAYKNSDNIKLINSVTRKYSKQIDYDDLIDCGLQALWNCLKKHEPGRQKFTSSLYKFVNWECLRKLEEKKRNIKTVSMVNLNEDYDESQSKYEKAKNDVKKEILDYLELLNNDDREILIDYYYNGMTMEEIGHKNGFSKQTAKNKIKKALTLLRKKYDGY